MVDFREALESLSEKGARMVQQTVLGEINQLGGEWRRLTDRIEEAERKKREIRPRLIHLIEAISPEKTVVTDEIKVSVVPLAPIRHTNPAKFVELLFELAGNDLGLLKKILSACVEVKSPEAAKLLFLHFGEEAREKLAEITTQSPQGPRLLVTLLTRKEEK
ncbi:MAG: hypothetical protein LR000_01915 [Candidatus Pacebacteria bacterium]|nr:hypothetical protein [Candidatus Paceibacterota bacterium]